MTSPGDARTAIVTIPNIISFARILLVPVFVWLLLGVDRVAEAGWLLGFIGATDWIDGYLARRLGQVSEVGKMLDPVADRLAVAAAVIGGLIADVLPGWFAWGLIAREVLMAIVTGYLAMRTGAKLSVRYLGKVATLVLYAAISGWFIGEGMGLRWVEAAALIAGGIGLVIYWVVAFAYLGDARAILSGMPAEAPEG